MSQMATPNANQTIHPSAGQKPAPNVDMARVKYGAWLVGVAFILLGLVFGIAVSKLTTAADVTAVVGSVATVVGTIIGAFFGVQLASQVDCLPPTTRRFLTGTGSRSSPRARHLTGSAGRSCPATSFYDSGCASTARYLVSNFI